jgi:tripartite-type tricarboxylate transporter receptor subunit TctC
MTLVSILPRLFSAALIAGMLSVSCAALAQDYANKLIKLVVPFPAGGSSGAAHHKSGKLTLLATTAPKRHPDFPDTPTLAELGVKGMEYEQWFGLLAPAGTPKHIIEKLNAAMVKAVATPNSKERIAWLLMDLATGSAADFGKRVESDAQRWIKLASAMGIKPLD